MGSGYDHPDAWIRERSLLSPEKMHALGFLTLIWGSCEHWTRELFRQVAGIPTKQARIISHDLGDQTLWQKIFDLAAYREFDEDVVDALKHVSKYHDRCRINRNTFVHAGLAMGQSDDGSALTLYRMKGPEQFGAALNDSLENIRKVCEECQTCKGIIAELTLYLAFYGDKSPPEPLSLPDKPPLPEFVWSPPIPVRQQRQRQPPPSQE